jgi:hypothetical protein
MPRTKSPNKPANSSVVLIIPELEHAKTAVLNTLASVHSRRAYKTCHRQICRLVLL